ncbi:MAG: hypothetical protein HYZ27_00835 [Deltaproteobacteria bacterium]|nr:hypothetical protein [Deltaproteobacteria bacterium]
MSDASHPLDPLPDASADKSLAANHAFLADIAKSVRRIQGDDTYDASGVRKIWHQGQKQIEIMTWEKRDGGVVEQELSFMGLIIACKGGHLRTGKIPIDSEYSSGGRPASHMLAMDAEPSPRALDYASHLLKSVPERDYYVQHLLKAVNDAITTLGFDTSRTVVSSLAEFAHRPKPAGTDGPGRARAVAFVLLALAALCLAFALGWLLA